MGRRRRRSRRRWRRSTRSCAHGKVRYVGCSNYSGWQLMKALGDRRRAHGYQRFVSQQIHYTLQAREAEYELVPIAVDQGVGILVWSPLAGGLLSGKYRRGAGRPGGLARADRLGRAAGPRRGAALRHRRRAGGDRRGARRLGRAGRARLAARPARRRLGGRRRAHRGAARRQPRGRRASTLSDDERARLDEVSAPPLLYPYWHQAKTAADRLSPADLTLLARIGVRPLESPRLKGSDP